MKRFFASVIISVVLTGCTPDSSISFGGGSGVVLQVTDVVILAKDTIHTVINAGSMVIGTVQSVRRDVVDRVDKVQRGAEKLQEGSNLIKQGLGAEEEEEEQEEQVEE